MSTNERKSNALCVTLFDPTGNVTALCEDPVPIEEQSAAAARIMARFPAVEQVGFVRLPAGEKGELSLRMAGGEFCGNASMSAAALYLLRRGAASDAEETISLRVSGVKRAVEVTLCRESAESFHAAVRMPPAAEIVQTPFSFGSLRGSLPLVRMEGIAHAIVTDDSPFFTLMGDAERAGETAGALCAACRASALGLMFLEGAAPRLRLTPLVYVPGSGTLFWERSCASGSAAVGMALAARGGVRVRLELNEPGGVLRVDSDPQSGETLLTGRTRYLGTELL